MSDELATVTRMSPPVGRRGPVTARLRAVHPREVSFAASVAAAPCVVGRTSASATCPALKHETVSRSHFEIVWDGELGAHVGRDLGSHNGSRIDGATVGSVAQPLRDQAVVQLGDVCLVYEVAPGVTVPDEALVELDACPGRAPLMEVLRANLLRAAADPSPVLVIGETGTGKEFIARELHAKSGRKGSLLSVNCAALSSQLVDSQLFGHTKGAFTGATADAPGMFRAADGGTLFLDEIGELPLELQPKLLRALQEGEVQPVGGSKVVKVDVRVVAATNRELAKAVDAGAFRRDLYARLSLWELRVPALRQRRGDLFDWIDRMYAQWLLRRDRNEVGESGPELLFDPEVAEVLLLHEWPNNLREVDRLVHALATTAPAGELIGRGDLPEWFVHGDSSSSTSQQLLAKRPVPTREEFTEVFERLGGNVRALAKHFERDRRQIYRWIESYGLSRPKA
jgi:transcriptional regulator with PAS, ATPase and Fis domain